MSTVTHDTYSYIHKTHNKSITKQQYLRVSKKFRTISAKKILFEDEIEMLAAKSKILLQADLEILTSF